MVRGRARGKHKSIYRSKGVDLIRIFSLDLSVSSTGWAYYDSTTKTVLGCGKIQTNKKDFVSEDERINHIVDEIRKIIEDLSVGKKQAEIIGIENQFVGKSFSIMVLRKLLGCVVRMAYKELHIGVVYIAPTSVKKYVTGKGKADKSEVAEVIKEKYYDPGEYSDKPGKNKTSDIYDAIGIAIALGETLND